MTRKDRFYQVIQKPLITEKATDDSTWRNTYHFQVPVDATKVEIRQAVESLFGVKVLSVNTLRAPRKWRRRGYSVGQTPAWKKAMVQLREEDKIEVL
jgi:large subunit ribosomal protein L23